MLDFRERGMNSAWSKKIRLKSILDLYLKFMRKMKIFAKSETLGVQIFR